MAHQYLPKLGTAAWKALSQKQIKRAFLVLDACLEHLIPPFSILLGTSLICLGSAGILFIPTMVFALPLQFTGHFLAKTILVMGFGLLLCQAAYLLSGLRLVKATPRIYSSLLFAPIYAAWKIREYIKAIFDGKQATLGWVRTTRNEGIHE